MIPDNPFQITVDIYEEDVVKLAIGNAVEIKLTAFPDKIFKGKVVSIDPAEKIIEGVVYYEAKIELEDYPETIKPGMTADLTIKTVTKENVLAIPGAAIEEKDNKTTVQVFKKRHLETREIEIGLKGSNDIVEVISGLEEGEEVAIWR
jgi:multidrug efflux pump subunit AcrA (membrane-fusion protein)